MITGNCQETIAKLTEGTQNRIPVINITEKESKDKATIEHLLKKSIHDFTGEILNNDSEYKIKLSVFKDGEISESKKILKRKKFNDLFSKLIIDAAGIRVKITLASGMDLIPFIVVKS